MTIKIIAPDDDKKEFFEKSVKPLLSTAMENNAVDKWMFNIEDDGGASFASVDFGLKRELVINMVRGTAFLLNICGFQNFKLCFQIRPRF
jgi:hypothetical protein